MEKTSAQIKPHVIVTDAGHLCGSEKGSTSHIKQLMTLLWAGRCKQKITTDHWITGNVACCLEKAYINLKYSIKVVCLFQLFSSYQKKSMICSPKTAWWSTVFSLPKFSLLNCPKQCSLVSTCFLLNYQLHYCVWRNRKQRVKTNMLPN